MKITNRKYTITLLFFVLPLFLITCVENHVLPNFGTISVDSDPQGAEVILNGESKGETPLIIQELLSGDYSLRLIRTEFVNQTISIILEENETETVDIYLIEEEPKGEIVVKSNPSDASIFLNNTNTNFKTPHTFSNLERGQYNFNLKINLYDDANFTINLSKDETIEKNTNLAIAGSSGGLTINSIPSGATLFIDDINTGVTPYAINPITPGNYSIKLTLDEYKDTSFTATVSAGNTTTLDILLKGLFVIDVTVDPEEGGTISGAGGYTEGENVILVATPNTGYNFVNWKEGSTILTTNTSLNFVTTGDRNLTATFELKEYLIEATTNPESAGNVSGTGTFKHGESVELSFTANSGYEFINWTENDNQVSTNNNYTFNATGDRNLVANFKELGSLSVNSNPDKAEIYLNGTNTGEVTPHEFTNLDVGDYTVELKLEHFADISRDVEVTTNNTTDLGTITLLDITPDVTVDITYVEKDNGRLAFDFDFNQDLIVDVVIVNSPDGKIHQSSYGQLIYDINVLNWNYGEKIIGSWKFVITGTKYNGRKAEYEVTKFVTVN